MNAKALEKRCVELINENRELKEQIADLERRLKDDSFVVRTSFHCSLTQLKSSKVDLLKLVQQSLLEDLAKAATQKTNL